MNDIKQVIVWRKDLQVRLGKKMAQSAHASMKVFFDRMEPSILAMKNYYCYFTEEMVAWMNGDFKKIVVGIDSLEELLKLYEQAKEEKIPCAMIEDLGLTEFKEPTITCVAIGPDMSDKIDKITGRLKLL
jgi:peptidyl-tRNA hydrolase, PTH2 family